MVGSVKCNHVCYLEDAIHFWFACVLILYCDYFRYVGNIHVNVTEKLLAEIFQSAGPLAGCKLIRKDKVDSVIDYAFLYDILFGYDST